MNAILRKEVRLLMPAWIAALLQATLPSLFLISIGYRNHSDLGPLIFGPLGFGILLMGLASFGQEFSAGTFSILLAQPIPRRKIWRLKIGILSLASLTVLASFLICFAEAEGMQFARLARFPAVVLGQILAFTVSMTMILGTALWTTILFRQISAAFWFSILVPAFIGTFTVFRLENFRFPANLIWLLIVFGLYSVGSFLWARWMFLRAQDTAWTGGEIYLPKWLGFRTQTTTQVVVPKLKPLRALVRKEFQSHHITLLIGALLLVSHLVGIVVRKLEFDPTNPHKAVFEVFGFWWLLWFALPMIIGATVVAEERKLGTLEGQLCLPVKRGWQFAVKLGMALVLGVFLGGVMPAVCEGIGLWAGVSGEFPVAQAPGFGIWLVACCLIATGITLVSIYASTLTRNLLQALGTAVLVAIGLWAFGVGVVQQEHFSAPLWTGPLGIYIGLPVMVATLMWLAFKNFKSLQVGLKLWLRNLFTVLVAMVLIVAATTLIWNRVWELGMTLEPAHGSAQLTGAVRPSISTVWGGKIFALLPDGRIWSGDKFEVRETGYWEIYRGSDGEDHLRKGQMQVPVGGSFVAGSNWTQLASSHENVVGIRADGTLWHLFQVDASHFRASVSRAPRLDRIGNDSDWQTVTSGAGGFAALKRDGSLWTWGRADEKPVRLGSDSDWTSVFGSDHAFAGIKRDGSVWKWGYLPNRPGSSQIVDKDWKQQHPEPVLWYPVGGDWVAMAMQNNFDLLIKRDGTAWIGGFFWGSILGEAEQRYGAFPRDMAQTVQVGAKADWAEIKSDWHSLVALNKNGMIYHNDFRNRHLAFRGSMWELSRRADWIAVEKYPWIQSDLALAADGTLAAWGDPMNGSHGLLGPSRPPLWTLNIFAEIK